MGSSPSSSTKTKVPPYIGGAFFVLAAKDERAQTARPRRSGARESPCGFLLWAQKGFLANGVESVMYDRISIHAPCVRGDQARLNLRLNPWKFQFTPLCEGRPLPSFAVILLKEFQFTPLREGRQHAAVRMIRVKAISIHAPA